VQILRARPAWGRLGVGKSVFYEDYVYRPGRSEFVTGTKSVKRLRPVAITPRIEGFVDREIDDLIEAKLAERDAGLLVRPKVRDALGKFTKHKQPAAA
jgi:predicted transcriptional regulator